MSGSQLAHASPQTCEQVQVGAIRWDAWRGDENAVGVAVEKSLGVPRWKSRWPTFYTETDEDLDFEGASPKVVKSDNEIAHAAGLKYWAYVFYGRRWPTNEALNQYLLGSGGGMQYSLILEMGRLLKRHWRESRGEILEHLAHARYLREPSGSPVLFVMLYDQDLADLDTIARELEMLSQEAMERQAGKPSLIVLMQAYDKAATVAKRFNASRISSYIFQAGANGGTYRELTAAVEAFWERQASTDLGVVPIVMSGWDPRPLIETPVPWFSYRKDVWYQLPTGDELRDHLRNGIHWAKKHPSGGCLVLVYAWNEFAEGGWIAPTVGDPTTRLSSVREAIGAAEQ